MKTKKPELSEREKMKRFISNPDPWPNWPFLPMKRYVKGQMEAGFLLSQSLKGSLPTPLVLYRGYIFRLPASQNEWAALPKETFETIDALLDAGWEVD